MTNEQINQAIAKACGWPILDNPPKGFYPLYCTDLNAMHDAEKMLCCWEDHVSYQSWLGYAGGNVIVQLQQCITATARQRAEAFLRTLEKWDPTTEESSAVQSTSSGGSGGASTYGGKGLGIAGGAWPPETQITVNGKTFCLADIDKEMTE